MSFTDRVLILAVAAVTMSFSGCRWLRELGLLSGAPSAKDAGGDGAGEAPGPTFARVAPILKDACAETCHDGRAMASDDFVFVDSGDLRQRLLGPPPATVPPPCQNRPLVVPGQPDGSLLVAVIEEPDAPRAGCAERMPHSCPDRRPCITATDLETIRQWIAAGAPP